MGSSFQFLRLCSRTPNNNIENEFQNLSIDFIDSISCQSSLVVCLSHPYPSPRSCQTVRLRLLRQFCRSLQVQPSECNYFCRVSVSLLPSWQPNPNQLPPKSMNYHEGRSAAEWQSLEVDRSSVGEAYEYMKLSRSVLGYAASLRFLRLLIPKCYVLRALSGGEYNLG